MDLVTTSEQLDVITALEVLNVFLTNTKNEINSEQMAEILVCLDKIENKVKSAILQEKELDRLIKSYEDNISNQNELMENQQNILDKQSKKEDEKKEEQVSEEHGVIIDGF